MYKNNSEKNIKIEILNSKCFTKSLILIVTGIFAASSIVSIIEVKVKRNLENKIKKIYKYYGEFSEEANVLKYLDLGIEFDNLNLDRYISDIDANLKENKEELSSPYILNDKLEDFKSDEGKNNLSNLDYLRNQDKLIDSYVINGAYKIVYNNIMNALIGYTAKQYNISDKSKITFTQYKNDNEENTKYIIKYDNNSIETEDFLIKECISLIGRLKNIKLDSASKENLLDMYSLLLNKAIELESKAEKENTNDLSYQLKLKRN